MKERLFSLLSYLNLTPTQFADKLHIERSTLSHIKNDRSKPTLDLVKKIMIEYPKVNPNWLILGVGPMTIEPQSDSSKLDLFSSSSSTDLISPDKSHEQKLEVQLPFNKPDSQKDQPQNILSEQPTVVTAGAPPKGVESEVLPLERRIEKIVVFYSDKTFDEYVK